MIQVSKEKIFFSLPNSAILNDEDPRKNPLTRDLSSAHICPYCGILAQAIYKTEKPVRDLTMEFFGQAKPLEVSKFALATTLHAVSPRFYTYLITVDGQTYEMVRESYHFGINNTRVSGCCKVSKAVYFPGPMNLTRYLFGLARVINTQEWYASSNDYSAKLRAALLGPDPGVNTENAAAMFEQIKTRIQIAADVTGAGSPVWMLAKQDWGYYAMTRVIDNLTIPKTKKETGK